MPTVELDRYPQTIRALAYVLTDPKPGGRRIQRATSNQLVDVEVVGRPRVTVVVQEAGLYVKGFRNPHGSWFFRGSNNGSSELKFTCSYVGSGSLGIYHGLAEAEVARRRNRGNIEAAIETLSGFEGGNDLALRVPLATMAFILSEAIRFTVVFNDVKNACNGRGSFSFAELKPYVQNWQAISEGRAVADIVPDKIYTAHS